MIDVLHVPFTYFPDRTGGTETYVAALARGLRARGVESAVAAPVDAGEVGEYVHDGTRVYRFASAGEGLPLEQVYGAGDPVAAEAFAAVLQRVRPRVVHLHAWTSGISLRLLRAARAAGLPTLLTYHTPSVSCARGTLMRYGRIVCDGALFVDRCSRCVLQDRGVPLAIGAALAELPPAAGRLLRRAGLEGGAWTALRMTELIDARHEAFRAMVREIDHLVAVQDWVYDLLLFLGAPRAKVTLSRLALPNVDADAAAMAEPRSARQRAPGEPIRLAFFGRIDPSKGPHLVVAALAGLPGAPFTFDIFGAPQGREGEAYRATLEEAAARDTRVRVLPPVATAEVVARMREYDLVVVPSTWVETGPLVVPEAMAAGVPVLGSARGGIPSFIHHGVDGLLVAAGDVGAWTATLRRFVDEPALLPTLRGGVRPPETMARVVEEMAAVYRPLLDARREGDRAWHAGCS